MSYIELFLLAAGLCFDTFAVSLTGGICTQGSLGRRQILKIILCFAVFQAGLSFAGWLLGYSVSDYISKVDHWVAFVLLGYIGVKMIVEGCSREDESVSKSSLLNPRQLVLLSIATSIDAVAVGISLALVKLRRCGRRYIAGPGKAAVPEDRDMYRDGVRLYGTGFSGRSARRPPSRGECRQEVRNLRRPHPHRHRSQDPHRAPHRLMVRIVSSV